MSNFESISVSIDNLAEFLSKICDSGPWDDWFDTTYCCDCEWEDNEGREEAYCEFHHGCRYFGVIDRYSVIKLWLKEQSNG